MRRLFFRLVHQTPVTALESERNPAARNGMLFEDARIAAKTAALTVLRLGAISRTLCGLTACVEE